MSGTSRPGDKVTVSVLVAVEPEDAFEVFTAEIDRWWRRGPRFRQAGARRGIVHIEPKAGGRLFESFEDASVTRVIDVGRVTVWDPPARLVFEWRNETFSKDESTEVEVRFEACASGTRVTLEHRGFSALRPDHPVRHGHADAAFVRSLGMWWAALLTSLREHAAAR